ncbi:MAG: ParB N-terminal domain-containing protein [Treponema sp.]|jgi:ParB family chromosome partitioning protein|nr:ParB N-terminal domain-containing protein [Treponema sp.]
MQVPIKDIKVKRRVRKDLGDIASLAESLRVFGQINPIVITNKNILVAGERRLEAAKSLGWKTVNTVINEFPDALSRLEYEVEENTQRRDLSHEEIEEAARRIYRLKNPSFFRRFFQAIINFFKRIFGLD